MNKFFAGLLIGYILATYEIKLVRRNKNERI